MSQLWFNYGQDENAEYYMNQNLLNQHAHLYNEAPTGSMDSLSAMFNPSYYNTKVSQWQAKQDMYNTQAQWYREDTAYQRAVHDLKKAGLNPALLYSSAGSSSSSAPSSRQSHGASGSGALSGVLGLVKTALTLISKAL